MATMLNDDFSVGYKAQTAFGTPATQGAKSSWSWIKVTFPQDSPADEQEELQVSSGVTGAGDSVVPGRRSGTLTFSWDLTSQAEGFTSGSAPALTEITTLVAALFGNSAAGTYDASDILTSGSDGNTWATTSGTYAHGQAYGAEDSSGVIQAINWIEKQTGTDLALFQSSRATPAEDSDAIPFVNIYATDDQPASGYGYTLRVVGNDTAEDMRYTNVFPLSLSLTMTAAKGISATMVCQYYGRHLANDGGLYTTPQDLLVQPMNGQNHARIMIASNQIASLDSGTAHATGICGLDELSVSFEAEPEVTPCHASTDGVSACQLSNKIAKVTCFVPFDSQMLTGTVTETASAPDYNNLVTTIESYYKAQTAIAFTAEVGNTAGRCMALRIPRAYIDQRPQVATVGKRVGFRLSLRSAPYVSSDEGTTGAAGKAYTIAFA